MKRIFVIVLVLLFALPVFTPAAFDGQITFRGVKWYATESEVDIILLSPGAKKFSVSLDNNKIAEDKPISIAKFYSGIKVADYIPHITVVNYLFPIENGKIIRDMEKAMFYRGSYYFNSDENHPMLFDELKMKLTSLYGEPSLNEVPNEGEPTEYQVIWTDNIGNSTELIMSSQAEGVRLNYIANNSSERLEELNKIADQESKFEGL